MKAAAVVFTVVLIGPVVAHAVAPEAETRFRQGRELMTQGRVAEACTAFAQSYAIEPSSGTLLNLARCHEALGKTFTAWTEYGESAGLAREQGKPDRAAIADERRTIVGLRVPKLSLKISKVVPGMTIRTEQGDIPAARWGQALLLDPGTHHITAEAPGYLSWSTDVETKDAENVPMDVPELRRILATDPPLKPPAPATLSLQAVDHEGPTALRAGRLPVDAYLAGAGGLLVIAGSISYGVAHAEFENAISECDQLQRCTDQRRNDLVSSVDTWRGLAIASWIAGGVLVVASSLHYWFYRRPPRVTAAIDPWHQTFALQAAF